MPIKHPKPKKTKEKITRQLNASNKMRRIEKASKITYVGSLTTFLGGLLTGRQRVAGASMVLIGVSVPTEAASRHFVKKFGQDNLIKLIGKPRLSRSISLKVRDPWHAFALSVIGEARTQSEKKSAEEMNTLGPGSKLFQAMKDYIGE